MELRNVNFEIKGMFALTFLQAFAALQCILQLLMLLDQTKARTSKSPHNVYNAMRFIKNDNVYSESKSPDPKLISLQIQIHYRMLQEKVLVKMCRQLL